MPPASCPPPTLPWWRRAMLDYQGRHTGWSTWLRRNVRLIGEVTEAIRSNGPMSHGDFEGARAARARGGWWYVEARAARAPPPLDDGRRRHPRAPALPEALRPARAGAPGPAAEAVSADEFRRWHVERSLHAMGAATEHDLAGYLTFPRLFARRGGAGLRALLDSGAVTEIEVEGLRGRWLALTRDLPALARAGRRAAALVGDHAALTLRLAALVSRPGGAALRLRLPDRGLHAAARPRARLLHAAHPPSRPPRGPRGRQDASGRGTAGGAARPLRALAGDGGRAAGGRRRRASIGTRRWRAWLDALASLGRFVRAERVTLAPRDAGPPARAAGARAARGRTLARCPAPLSASRPARDGASPGRRPRHPWPLAARTGASPRAQAASPRCPAPARGGGASRR